MNEAFKRRFGELSEAQTKFAYVHPTNSSSYVPAGQWEGWATSAENLILAVYGGSAPHYANFRAAYTKCNGYDFEINRLLSLFGCAKEDFEGGYVFNVEMRISGEIFGDFVALARQSLSEGQKDVAAVLACAALEDAIKRLAHSGGLATDGKTMAELVNALKSTGLLAGAQKTLLDAMPRIRNMAMHAEWEKITEQDVGSVLGYVEQLLLSKFSSG